jgi:hypothetical protein
MTVQDYSESVANRYLSSNFSDGSVGAIDIALILSIVLQLLPNLPCLKPKTAEEKREWVENHPALAVSNTAQEIRKQAKGKGEKVARKHSRELAATIVNDYLSTDDAEIKLMGINL